MSSLEKKLKKIEMPKEKYNSLTIKERQSLHDLKNDSYIVIKAVNEGSAVVVWDRNDYILPARKPKNN